MMNELGEFQAKKHELYLNIFHSDESKRIKREQKPNAESAMPFLTKGESPVVEHP
jgi:hypothetical protein